jgi:hypothetical protein
MRIIINRVPRHNDDGEFSSGDNFSILFDPDRPLSNNVVSIRYLKNIQFRQTNNYMLFNYDELRPFV